MFESDLKSIVYCGTWIGWGLNSSKATVFFNKVFANLKD